MKRFKSDFFDEEYFTGSSKSNYGKLNPDGGYTEEIYFDFKQKQAASKLRNLPEPTCIHQELWFIRGIGLGQIMRLCSHFHNSHRSILLNIYRCGIFLQALLSCQLCADKTV